MEMVHVYTKRRSQFGRPCLFSDRPAELLVDIHPDPSLARNFFQKSTRDQAVQACQEMAEDQMNTEHIQTRSCGINHLEGGWPKDIDPTEMEETTRFRRKVEEDKSYINSVLKLGSVMEHCVRQNNAVDIYQQYFEDEEEVEEIQEPARTISNLHSAQGSPQALDGLGSPTQ